MSNTLALVIMIFAILSSVLNYIYTLQQNKDSVVTEDRASEERQEILKAVKIKNKNEELFDIISKERKKEINEEDRKDFSKIIKNIYSYLDSTSDIKVNTYLPSSNQKSKIRTDILITNKVAGHQIKIVVKLFPYVKDIDAIDVEIFKNELNEINATKGVVVTRGGFKASAKKIAEKYNMIDLCTIKDAKNRDWNDEIKIPVIINWFWPKELGMSLDFVSTITRATSPMLSPDCLISNDNFDTFIKLGDLIELEWNKSEPDKLNFHSGMLDLSYGGWQIKDVNNETFGVVRKLSLTYELLREKYFAYLTPEDYTIFKNHTSNVITSKVILKFPKLFNPSKSKIWRKIDNDNFKGRNDLKHLDIFMTNEVNLDDSTFDNFKIRNLD